MTVTLTAVFRTFRPVVSLADLVSISQDYDNYYWYVGEAEFSRTSESAEHDALLDKDLLRWKAGEVERGYGKSTISDALTNFSLWSQTVGVKGGLQGASVTLRRLIELKEQQLIGYNTVIGRV